VIPVTSFFAMPGETRAWLDVEVERLGLSLIEDPLPSGPSRYFVWPFDAPPLPEGAFGVLVHPPAVCSDTLTMGDTGWRPSAFPDTVAASGRRLNRQLATSLRKIATVPLFAVSYDGSVRDAKPTAWGTEAAISTGLSLRKWRDGAVTFQP
jgi:hypothetical protein